MFVGCKKDCEKNGTGSFRVNNSLSDPYEIWIDNSYEGTAPAFGSKEILNVPSGNHDVEYIQESGWTVWATKYTQSITVVSCNQFNSSL